MFDPIVPPANPLFLLSLNFFFYLKTKLKNWVQTTYKKKWIILKASPKNTKFPSQFFFPKIKKKFPKEVLDYI